VKIAVFMSLDTESKAYAIKISRYLCDCPGIEIIGQHTYAPYTAELQSYHYDIGVSVGYNHIFKPEHIALFPHGIINLHPSLLPYNRGAMPNVWSIVDGTPAGATLHYIDEGIDTGDIIAQRHVPVESTDTGETLYHKCMAAGVELFKETWPKIMAGKNRRVKQPVSQPAHRAKDINDLDEISKGLLMNILRARTFPPHESAYFIDDNGQKVFVEVKLRNADER